MESSELERTERNTFADAGTQAKIQRSTLHTIYGSPEKVESNSKHMNKLGHRGADRSRMATRGERKTGRRIRWKIGRRNTTSRR
jgi:hypothetical protein